MNFQNHFDVFNFLYLCLDYAWLPLESSHHVVGAFELRPNALGRTTESRHN